MKHFCKQDSLFILLRSDRVLRLVVRKKFHGDKGWIDSDQLSILLGVLHKTSYGEYLRDLLISGTIDKPIQREKT